MPENIFGRVDPPSGTIAYWDNDLSNIPAGWVICDGNNGTPDLLDDYLKSVVDGNTDPGSRGGTHNKQLSEQQLPTHRHDTDSTGTTGSHNHAMGVNEDNDPDPSSSIVSDNITSGTVTTNSAGSHSHSYSDSAAGSGNTFDNKPSSYELVPIMKA